MHTILGANGTIATELLPILHANKEQIRLVSRNPKPVSYAQNIAADMLNYEQVASVVKGADIVYLLVGIEYNHKVWQRDWPVIMRNVINACKAANARLIFFDNVYPYGIVKGKINESTQFNPVSKKGKIRAEIDTMLLNEIKSGALNAIIARAADFYGPRCTDKSAPGMLVFSRLKKKQTPSGLLMPTCHARLLTLLMQPKPFISFRNILKHLIKPGFCLQCHRRLRAGNLYGSLPGT